ncbi:MAG TPA: DUF4147 domain-containing protein [Anaerolineae bacterium]|jgi:hydroxypyruvate reductase
MTQDTNSLRRDFEAMIKAALHAADPFAAVKRYLQMDGSELFVDSKPVGLHGYDRVLLISVGKAAFPMASAVTSIIGTRLTSGVIVTKYGHVDSTSSLMNASRLTIIESAHPVPDENSLKAGEVVAHSLENLDEHTLVLACISGGASALMISPYPGIQLRTMRALNDALLKSGADIGEMNLVRSRLERLKNGGFVALAKPATVIGLIVSDVIGDPLSVIASGLTNHPAAHNNLVANNEQACLAVAAQAQQLGYKPRIVTTSLQGEASARGRDIANAIAAQSAGTCLIYGGEPTVTIHGNGLGGRNQELALAAAIALGELPEAHASLCALATDGTDGPTQAGGAFIFPDTLARARSKQLEPSAYLVRNDSYHFFEALGDLIMTGPTGTNVADVVIALR